MQTTLQASNKTRRMIDYLQESIHSGILKQGERIPTLRALKEQFGISLGTTKSGIDHLCRKGILKSNRGSGTFVATSPISESINYTSKIMVLMEWFGTSSGILPTLYSGIFEENKKRKTQLILSHVDFKEFGRKNIKSISKGFSALILLGAYDTLFQENLNLNMPIVASGMHSNLNGSVSLFEMDPYHSAELAVEYFKKHNISHVKCYTGNFPVGVMRSQQFQLQWEAVGGTIEYQQFNSNDEANKFRFEPNGAFLFSSGWLMDTFCKRSTAEFDLQLPESATILGLDGRCCIDPYFEPAPTIYTDWKQMGRDIFIECMRRINNPGISPRRYYYPSKQIDP